MFRFLLKKRSWNWCSSWPLLNKPGVQGLIQPFASFSDFRFNPSLVSMLSVNFRILSLFLRVSEICCLLIPNSGAKFVPFSPLSKREIIICLSFIERTDRFRFVDMLSFWVMIVSCVYITHAHRTDQAWHSLSNKTILNQSKFSWTH